MPPPPPSGQPTKAAEPRYGAFFDPWNSSSTGHQRAENRLGGSTGWRESRTAKLQSQFRSDISGGERLSDKVGAGSKDWVPQAKALIRPESHARAKNSVMGMLIKPGTMRQKMMSTAPDFGLKGLGGDGSKLSDEERRNAQRKAKDDAKEEERNQSRKMFDGVVVYVNGSTHPLISDLKLKQVLAENGARMSIHLGRRQVTHVILGRPTVGGAGGGLAGGKLQKEIQKVRGCGVKFVGVEWVLESIETGKRLSEARFSNLKMATKGQQSVYGLAAKSVATEKVDNDEPPPSGQAS